MTAIRAVYPGDTLRPVGATGKLLHKVDDAADWRRPGIG